jgi:cell division septal protein FtsQ
MSGVSRKVDAGEDVFQFRPKLRFGCGRMVKSPIDELSKMLDDLPTVAARATATAQQGISKVHLERHSRVKRKSRSNNENRAFALW